MISTGAVHLAAWMTDVGGDDSGVAQRKHAYLSVYNGKPAPQQNLGAHTCSSAKATTALPASRSSPQPLRVGSFRPYSETRRQARLGHTPRNTPGKKKLGPS